MNETYPGLESLPFRKMGTEIEAQIVVRNPEEQVRARETLSGLPAAYERIEAIFSRFRPESELSRLNASLGESQPVSPEMAFVAGRALVHHAQTGGLYDPRVIDILEATGYASDFHAGDRTPAVGRPVAVSARPLAEDMVLQDGTVRFGQRMDFAGIVKGYVTDLIADGLIRDGWRDYLVDSGGDMRLSGEPPEGGQWHISIEGVSEQDVVFSLSDEAVATSGITRRQWEQGGKRYHHLIDPRHPGEYAFDLRTVTVVAARAEEADVWAKTLFLLGREEGIRRSRERGLKSIFWDERGLIWGSPEALRAYWRR